MTSATRQRYVIRSLPLFGVFVSATLYALALSTRAGRHWTQEQTWSTVAAGVVLVTSWLAVEDKDGAKRTLLYFCVAGVPMVVRSLLLQLQRIDAVIERAMR